MNYMKNNLGLISLLLFIALCISVYFNFKPIETKPITITIPSKSDSVDIVKPIPLPKPQTNTEYIKINDTIEIPVENEVNLTYLRQLQELLIENDSLKLIMAYLKAIEVNRYHEVIDNKDIKIDTYATTTGTLDSLRIVYNIKEQKINFDIPENKSKILIGGGLLYLNNNYENNQIQLFGGLGYLTKKNDLIDLNITSNGYIFAGYKTTLFK